MNGVPSWLFTLFLFGECVALAGAAGKADWPESFAIGHQVRRGKCQVDREKDIE